MFLGFVSSGRWLLLSTSSSSSSCKLPGHPHLRNWDGNAFAKMRFHARCCSLDSCKIIAVDSLSDASLYSDTTFGPAAKNQFCTHGSNWQSVWTLPYNLRPDIGWWGARQASRVQQLEKTTLRVSPGRLSLQWQKRMIGQQFHRERRHSLVERQQFTARPCSWRGLWTMR